MELLAAVAPGVAARLHDAAGAQARIVVVALGVSGVLRVVQLVQRRCAEAFTVGTAYHQLLDRLVAERVFRVGGAAKVAVLVVTHGGRQFEAVEYGHVQLGVHRLDVTVTRDAGVRVGAEAGDIRDKTIEGLVELLLTVFTANRQAGRAGAEPVADLTAHAPVDTGDPAHRRHVLAVILVLVDIGLPGRCLRAERVDDAIGNAVEHGRVAGVTARHTGVHLILVVRGADIVIPTLGHTIEAQYQTLAGVLVFALAATGSGFTPVQADWLRRVEGRIAATRGYAVARVVRRARVHAGADQGGRGNTHGIVVAGPEVLQVDVVDIGDLAGGLAEKGGLLGFRQQVDIVARVIAA